MAMCGGMSGVVEADDEVHEICKQIRQSAEEKAGRTFDEFTATHFASQVVAGTNFFIKVRVATTESVHLRVYRPLPHTGKPAELAALQEGKSHEEPLEYFK